MELSLPDMPFGMGGRCACGRARRRALPSPRCTGEVTSTPPMITGACDRSVHNDTPDAFAISQRRLCHTRDVEARVGSPSVLTGHGTCIRR
jgi:hypothetical protein